MADKQIEKFVEDQLVTLTTEILYHERAAQEASQIRDSHILALYEAQKQRQSILSQFPGRNWTLGLVEKKDEKDTAKDTPILTLDTGVREGDNHS